MLESTKRYEGNASYRPLTDRLNSGLGRAVAAGTLVTILSGCAGVVPSNPPQFASASNVATDTKDGNPSNKFLDSLLSDRSIDTAFREGEYFEGVVRVPYDFARKTIIRGVTAPKTFLYDLPKETIKFSNEKVANSVTEEDKLGHRIGGIIFFPVLYVGHFLKNFFNYVKKNPIEAVIHGAAYGVIGAEISGGSKSSKPSPSPAAPAPPGPGGFGG